MGYFANGTEEEMYRAQYCDRCKHDNHPRKIDEGGCAIYMAHLLYNYEFDGEKDENGNKVLHELIPHNGTENGQCYMFDPIEV